MRGLVEGQFGKCDLGQVLLPYLQVGFVAGGDEKQWPLIFGLAGFASELHTSFQRGLTPLFQVTGFACNNNVRPAGFTAAGSGYNVVNRKRMVTDPTILTGEVISA